MIQRRDVLKAMAGTATWAMAWRLAAEGSARVRVTLVRWPYT